MTGNEHSYTSYGGIVAGGRNTASGPYSSVSGGYGNTASGGWASILGGNNNTVTTTDGCHPACS